MLWIAAVFVYIISITNRRWSNVITAGLFISEFYGVIKVGEKLKKVFVYWIVK